MVEIMEVELGVVVALQGQMVQLIECHPVCQFGLLRFEGRDGVGEVLMIQQRMFPQRAAGELEVMRTYHLAWMCDHLN